MQLVTFLSAAAAIVSVSSAETERTAVSLNKVPDAGEGFARVINRCDYDVYIWSVLKGTGCPESGMVTLKKGETYSENYAKATDNHGPNKGQAVSIKISRTRQCKGNDITQLEYYIDNRNETQAPYQLNYFDVSYVDCAHDCPTKQEGYYLKAGNQVGEFATKNDNTWCPILSCSDAASCAKMSYILPDDVQTKTCGMTQNLDFYMCGSQPPSDNDYKPSVPSKKPEAPKPAPPLSEIVSSAANYKAIAAAVTPAPQIPEPPKAPKVKTNIVYVTEYKYVNEKRHDHAHAHARRHQVLHA